MAAAAEPAAISAAPDLAVGRGPTDRSGYLFVAFFTIPFLLFNITPIFFGIYLSFTEWGIIGAPTWVGLANFREALADDWVANAFLNTLRYALIIVPGVTVLGLLFAVFVHQRWPLATLARTLFFTPDGPGFARLTVMDARGVADSVVVRIE